MAVVLAPSGRAVAQQGFQTLGPNECLNCHDHDAERQWYEKKEIPEVQRLFPDKKDNAGHINSLKQLETAKSKEFADAIGLKDKYDLNGPCVGCHATVFAGDANAGVSCESCHGPASGYLKPHQAKDAYDASVAQYGMTRLVGNIRGWTQQCTNCHVMNDERLIKAGHPSGDDFDLGQKFQPVSVHFKKKYDASEVSAIGLPEMAAIIRRRRPGATLAAAPSPNATPSPAIPTPAAPGSEPSRSASPLPTPAPSPNSTTPSRLAVPTKAVDVAPAGSPTSIEPAAGAELSPPSATADLRPPTSATPPSDPSTVALQTPDTGRSGRWIVLGGLVALLLAGAALWFRRSGRSPR